ncbi:hypothetical protein HK104_010531 [Borealophlyctis nickersoniae]|nr:hypothetical protein HK104_010531 [Borealophlyctis nickersoniae]
MLFLRRTEDRVRTPWNRIVWEPWIPDTKKFDVRHSFNQDDLDVLRWDLGMNVIRLSVPWHGIELVRGQYNETLIQNLKSLVELCNLNGMYVLLDLHQDALSPKEYQTGCLNRFQTSDFLATLGRFDARLYRMIEVTYEGKIATLSGQLSFAVGLTWQRLYKNYDGLSDAFAAFWKRIAQEFGSYPNVLGYDIINEPFAGNTVENPSLLVPGVADNVNLQPFYEKVVAAIREADPVTIIMFEGVTWDNGAVGFTAAPGGPTHALKTAHSWHYYHNPGPNVDIIEKTVQYRRKDASKLGCGSILTEFSFGYDCGPACIMEHVQTMEAVESMLIGWIGFRSNEVVPELIPMYSRPYPSVVSGHIISFSFDYTSKIFSLHYRHNPESRLPTEIVVHPSHYPTAFDVLVEPEGVTTWNVLNEERLILVQVNDHQKVGSGIVSVEVRPKDGGAATGIVKQSQK